jgi:hypothetical protein
MTTSPAAISRAVDHMIEGVIGGKLGQRSRGEKRNLLEIEI